MFIYLKMSAEKWRIHNSSVFAFIFVITNAKAIVLLSHFNCESMCMSIKFKQYLATFQTTNISDKDLTSEYAVQLDTIACKQPCFWSSHKAAYQTAQAEGKHIHYWQDLAEEISPIQLEAYWESEVVVLLKRVIHSELPTWFLLF